MIAFGRFLTAALVFFVLEATAEEFFPPDGYPVFEEGVVDCPPDWDERLVCRKLKEPFGYSNTYNGKQVGFEAAKGLITDGASIPFWAQPLIGMPHEKAFSRAAVLHDHYVLRENSVYSYLLVQRMFHDVLLASGVGKIKARTMYIAVLIGAPKYSLYYRAPADTCVIVPNNCVNVDGKELAVTAIDKVEAVYDRKDFQALVEKAVMSVDLETVDLSQIEQVAIDVRKQAEIPTPPAIVYDASTGIAVE